MLLLPPFAAGSSAGSLHTSPASRAEHPPGQCGQDPATYQAAPGHPNTRDIRAAEAKPKIPCCLGRRSQGEYEAVGG